jgi:MoxR-like ATPase
MIDPETAYADITDEISTVLVGNEDVIEAFTISVLTGGHVLVEGVPGVAKTTAADLFANVLGLEHRRLQMTPDMLPADITGTHVYHQSTESSELARGPIFSNAVVVDEITRATPKAQSALLEAMEEETVTIEGETLSLPDPFIVIATKNSVETDGTFDLPKSQRDRFQFTISMEPPDRDAERELINRSQLIESPASDAVSSVLGPEEIRDLREQVRDVHVADPIKEYILDIVAAVRESEHVRVGPSPRASLAFVRAGQARAAIHGRTYVTPDDIKSLRKPILTHRVVRTSKARVSDRPADTVIADALLDIEPPSETTPPNVEA